MTIDKKIIIGVCFVIVCIFGWFLFRGKVISDDTCGNATVGGNLQSVRNQQQQTNDRIESIQTGVTETKDTVRRLDDRLNVSQAVASDSAGLIREGKQILAGIRERNEIKK